MSTTRRPAQPSAQTDEIFVLMLRMLESDPRLANSFAALRDDAEAAGLLGARMDWTGASQPASYAHAVQRLGPPPNAEQLPQLLTRLVDFSTPREPSSSRLPFAVSSLLRGGRLALAPPATAIEGVALPLSKQWSASFRHPAAPSTDVSLRRRAVSASGSATRMAVLSARQMGVRLPASLQPPRLLLGESDTPLEDGPRSSHPSTPPPGALRALTSTVGHRAPIYCCVHDRTGSRVFTGSDDMNIKMWCASPPSHIPLSPPSHTPLSPWSHTSHQGLALRLRRKTSFLVLSRCAHSGYLQHTCRGHTGEITEMAVSPCNTWLVSAAMDGTARVWRIPDGTPEAVLTAHATAVNSVAFTKSVSPARLLSIGQDASILLWRADAWHEPPIVLRAPQTPANLVPGSAGPAHAPIGAGGGMGLEAAAAAAMPAGGGGLSHQQIGASAQAAAAALEAFLRPPPSATCCAINATGRVAVVGLSVAPYLLAFGVGDGDEEGKASTPPQRNLPGHHDEVTVMCFNHRGDVILTGSHDGTARVRECHDEPRHLRMRLPTPCLRCLIRSPRLFFARAGLALPRPPRCSPSREARR